MTNNKIIKIIDEYTVIINAGFNQDVEIGDKFQILDKKSNPVKDPDTGEVLGYLDLVKDTVTVSEVQEKMCFGESATYSLLNESIFQNIRNLNRSIGQERKRLNIDLDQVTGGLSKSDKPIRVGDSVRLIKSSTGQTKE